ncbi:hypothetical protein, partial [Lentzea sp. NPDC051838]|uniref:hypothetical protein n=1 Tax=Lentzea sp. NPDC051838 TaxID=3154849 RepID=UPI0034457BC5
MNRPMWNRLEDPNLLLRFVETRTAATLLPTLPPRSTGVGPGPIDRTRTVYDAFVGVGIRYADESAAGQDGWQEIRGPTEVLKTARLANCVDLAVVLAGACLDAGVHPLIVLLEPIAGGPAHALVVAWTAGTWPGPGAAAEYRDFAPDGDGVWPRGLRDAPEGPGAFLPLDVTRVTGIGESFDDAVRAGADLLASESFRVFATLDVGLRYRKQGEFRAEPRRLTGIQTHREEVAGLRDLQQNLLEANLPFVPPTDPGARSAPHVLLERLGAETGAPGVLLVGAAGVGKTRTCFEVAAQAVNDGWAVMHITAGEAAVTSTDLYEAIIAEHADRILIVLDYLNAYAQRLDLATLRYRVLADAARYGTKVAFIASCRPGWHATTDAPLTLLFDVVELEPDDAQTVAIRDQILRRVAPHATHDLGLQEMRKLAGSRPVIAMLIASEVERLHELGDLKSALPSIRPADLLSWLERRLAEDDLLPKRPRRLFADNDAEPSHELQTCVAMLLATPQPEADLIACGEQVKNAEPVLRQLMAMKWLVATSTGIVPAHDLVTDQLVEKILLQQPGAVVQAVVADRVLNASLTAARTVGRYAMNLGRIIRDMASAEASALRSHCASWISGNAVAAGEALARGEDDGAYAIGSVLESPAWSPVAFTAWTDVVDPWLRQHARSISARHLLYKGLRSDVGETDEHLVPESMAWLEDHGNTAEAGFVLAPLLARQLPGDVAGEAVGFGLAWLAIHDDLVEARFVVSALLGRELPGDVAGEAVSLALAWLAIHGDLGEARFVVSALLGRELPGDVAGEAVGFGLAWLAAHGDLGEARFVVSALLGRELPGDVAGEAVGFGLAWLAAHGDLGEAR